MLGNRNIKELPRTLLVAFVMRERVRIGFSTTRYRPIRQIWVFLRA